MHRCAILLAVLLGPIGAFQAAAAEKSPWAAIFVPAICALASNDTRRRAGKRRSETPAKLAEAQPIPPLPERKDPKAAQAAKKGAAAVPEVWSDTEIAAAKAHCAQVLQKLDAVYVEHPPIKEGKCGSAAPIRLMSLGTKQRVTFKPAALVNCDLASALSKWITQDVQPLAKKHLGERVTQISVMSDYACRASTGRRAHHRLSEHAYVDALDIRGFVTESGKTAYVLDTWGKTKRDIATEIAAAKAAAERQAAERAAADKAAQKNLQEKSSKPADAQAPTTVASNLGTAGAGLATRTRDGGVDKITITLPGAPVRKPLEIAARLGGPKAPPKDDRPAQVAALGPQSIAIPAPGPRSQFLRAAHAAACRIFGTTLGPEANEAHRNHFHVDMAERKYKKICD